MVLQTIFQINHPPCFKAKWYSSKFTVNIDVLKSKIETEGFEFF